MNSLLSNGIFPMTFTSWTYFPLELPSTALYTSLNISVYLQVFDQKSNEIQRSTCYTTLWVQTKPWTKPEQKKGPRDIFWIHLLSRIMKYQTITNYSHPLCLWTKSTLLFPYKQIVHTLRTNPNRHNILTNSFVLQRKLLVILTNLFVIRTNFFSTLWWMGFLSSVLTNCQIR